MTRLLTSLLALLGLGACAAQPQQLTDAQCRAILQDEPMSERSAAAFAQLLDGMIAEGSATSLDCHMLAERRDSDSSTPRRLVAVPGPEPLAPGPIARPAPTPTKAPQSALGDARGAMDQTPAASATPAGGPSASTEGPY